MELAPIILFTYNRPLHTQQVLDSLALNEEAKDSILYIYCDGAKENAEQVVIDKIEEVRLLAKNENRFKQVIIKEQIKNKGLANSIIDGVTEIVNKHGTVIVMEDDIICSKYTLKYMNEALRIYNKNEDVISISAYIYPILDLPEVFFIKGADCWGWATWKRGWDLFEPNGSKLLAELERRGEEREFDINDSYPYTQMLKNQIEKRVNSWAIRWYASAFLNNKLTLYPGKTLVHNIGFDGSGTHCSTTNEFDNKIEDGMRNPMCFDVSENKRAKEKIEIYFNKLKTASTSSSPKPAILQLLRIKIGRIYRKFFPIKQSTT